MKPTGKMRNRSLAVQRDSIPYCKGLRPYAKSVAGCIVMQQLDYWFSNHPDGFYKFLEPCPNSQYYKEGDSWIEELGMSVAEFRTAFDDIGIRYKSKTAFEASEDKFQGAFYCSYFDKQKGLTHYFRNHELVDSVLDELTKQAAKTHRREMQKVHLPEMQKVHPYKSTNSIPVDAECESIEMQNVHLPYLSTEITAETTTEITAERETRAKPTENLTSSLGSGTPPETRRAAAPLVDMSNPQDPRFTTPFYPAVALACGIRPQPMEVDFTTRGKIASVAAKFERHGYTVEQIATMRENWTMSGPPTPDQLFNRADSLLTARKTNGHANNGQQPERISNAERLFREQQEQRRRLVDAIGKDVARGLIPAR